MSNYIQLGDICRISSSKRIFEDEYRDNGVPFIRGLEISNKSLLNDDTRFECYISKERYNEIKKQYKVPQIGDILITAVGTIGNLVYINKNKEFYFKDGNVILFSDFNSSVYSKYLYYFMQSPFFKKQLDCLMIGAVQKALTMVMLKKVMLPLPSYSTQKFIADILSLIEGKIELNNKINTELENMAKTLYDYWFVQFDFPDENKRPYKSANGKMVYNEVLKREIPLGWEVKPLKRLIKHINTGLNPRDNFTLGNGNIKYITVKNITENNLLDFKNCDVIDNVARDKVHNRSDIKVGDILFASITPLGRCYLIEDEPNDWDINESVFSIRPDVTQISSEYLLMCLTSEYFIKKASNSSTGSIFTGIRIKSLEDMPTIVPPQNIIKEFTSQLKLLLKKKNICFKENINLEEIRDFLLPLLMNGQVTVSSER